ncbi:unnamed protein product, partial [marine sediment metagenome]
PDKTEFWGCNNVYKARDVDRLFIMHDIYVIQSNRDEDLIKNVNKKDFPVYTLGKYDEIKNNIQYPMKKVVKEFNAAFFINTVTFMLALAIMQKPKKIELYGVDMYFGTGTGYMRNDKGCIEFWLGVATGREIKIGIAKGSTLMRRRVTSNFYGMKRVERGQGAPGILLVPEYIWERPKCALKYKIVKSFIDL